jgi:PIN domain nuclease of toxin-antitoxin system
MLGKLQLRVRLPDMVHENEQQNGLVVLPITNEHVFYLDQLPSVHSDPFDRLIAAVACVEGATLLSADKVFRQYPVSVEG